MQDCPSDDQYVDEDIVELSDDGGNQDICAVKVSKPKLCSYIDTSEPNDQYIPDTAETTVDTCPSEELLDSPSETIEHSEEYPSKSSEQIDRGVPKVANTTAMNDVEECPSGQHSDRDEPVNEKTDVENCPSEEPENEKTDVDECPSEDLLDPPSETRKHSDRDEPENEKTDVDECPS